VAKIVVPTPNTTITSVWGKSVADTLNAGDVQAGYFTGTTNASGDLTVTFPRAFSAPPIVVANVAGGVPTQTLTLLPASVTATQFVVRTTVGSGAFAIGWIALGQRA
jgi:hypothetical protein